MSVVYVRGSRRRDQGRVKLERWTIGSRQDDYMLAGSVPRCGSGPQEIVGGRRESRALDARGGGPGLLCAASTRRTASAGSARTSHSHNRTTAQPASSASLVDRRSRSWFRAILDSQRDAFGPRNPERPWRGQPCQKSPSTKTATPRPGSTRSGVHPRASWRCRRKRTPAACSARRRSSSGSVCLLRRPWSCPLDSVVTHSPSTRQIIHSFVAQCQAEAGNRYDAPPHAPAEEDD